jgi:formylglycine-generating enzyme required for sulfatase activity
MKTVRRSPRVLFLLLAFTITPPWAAQANCLVVTNVSLANVSGGFADVVFDLGWSNSWRASWTEDGGATYITNWDAAWVFVKFRTSGSVWRPALLATNGHVATGGTVIEGAPSGGASNAGVFVYRDAEGSGPLSCPAMSLRWDYASSGLGGTNSVDVSVQAIEMVYIPQRSFKLGSGGTENYAFYQATNTTIPYPVTGEGAITVNNSAGHLYYASSGGDRGSPIPAAFPKGYAAIYCMKYEITQGQYTDFLNLLDTGTAATHYPGSSGLYRNTIGFNGTIYTSAAPDRAATLLLWSDLSSYMDWACLRPMTELEFEKICRGPLDPVPNEYPWGDTSETSQTNHAGTDGSGTETAMPTNANCNFGNVGIGGPVRAGIYARPDATRRGSGAGYYGVMELCGNMHELVITVGNSTGRAFDGSHGDGDGYHTPSTWPSTSLGTGARGGCHSDVVPSYGLTSDRYRAVNETVYQSRGTACGGRGVRTAP